MSDRKPDSYRERDGCHNCEHVFIRGEYDEPPYLYCTRGAPPRPPCCSVAMGECDLDDEERNKKWDAWKRGRRVRREGICNHWKEASDE